METLLALVLIFLIIYVYRKLSSDQKDQAVNKNVERPDIIKTFEKRMLSVGGIYHVNRYKIFNKDVDLEKKTGLGSRLKLYDLSFIFGAFDLIRQQLDPEAKVLTKKEFYWRLVGWAVASKIVETDLEAKMNFAQILYLHEPYNAIDDLLKDGAFSCENYLSDMVKEIKGNQSPQKPASRWFIPYYIENDDFLDDFKELIKDKSDLELMGLQNKKNITLMNVESEINKILDLG